MEIDGEDITPNAEAAGPSLAAVNAETPQVLCQEDAALPLQDKSPPLEEDTPSLIPKQNLIDKDLATPSTAASSQSDEPPDITMELPELMDVEAPGQKPPELIDETTILAEESYKSELKPPELIDETTKLEELKLTDKAPELTRETPQVTEESQVTDEKSEETVEVPQAEASLASPLIDKDKPSRETDEASGVMDVQRSESTGELGVETQPIGETTQDDEPELVGEIPELPGDIPEVIDEPLTDDAAHPELPERTVKLIEAARELGGQNDLIDDTTLLPDEAMNDDTNQRFEHVDTEMDNDIDEDRNISGQNSKDPFELTPPENGPEKAAVEQSEKEEANTTIESKDKEMKSLNNSVEVTEEAAPINPDTYYIMIQNVEFKQKCVMCGSVKIAKFNVRHHGDKTYICNDTCLFQFQNAHSDVTLHEYFTKFYSPVQIDASFKYSRQCKQCAVNLKTTSGICSWEALDFCKEHCLFRYQKRHSKSCAECHTEVAYNQMGKYAVRFGCIIRQFCSSTCLESRKKKIKICSYCQKSIHRTKTMIGNKYFCHDICKGMFEHLQKPKRPPFLINPDDARCFVCKSTNPMQIEFDYHRSSFYFCSSGCYTIFKFIQNCDTAPKKCHTCSKYALQQYLENHALYYDNMIHYFCSETCQHIYIITHRRVVPCVWCKVKKYNFDMIQKCNYLECNIFACSIFCLNQLKFNIDSILNRKKSCYNCSQEVGIYDVQLANGSTHTFCSNHCISLYQTQFTNTSTSTTPARRNTRGRTRQIIPDKPGPLPIITNVCSLAPSASKNKGGEATIKKIIIVKAPDLPEQRNMCTQVDKIKSDKETQLTIEYATQEIQTEIPENDMKVEPILAPIYIPQPIHMWNAPTPTPYMFPVVIPCPVFIPLTKNTGAAVMKEVKKVQVKAPTDPFEAELLMMAELVAAEKKDDVPEVESEEEEAPAPPEETYSPEPVDSSNAFGEDMLQMALKMATDFEEPPVDLEGALTANTITPQQAANEALEQQDIDDPEPVQAAPRPGRGRRRGRPPTRQTSRRGRRPANMEMPVLTPAESPPPMEPIEKPDANMCLKYTFGVNAWKQWVTTKNTELERSSRRLKLFKTELLQLTSDELNYSLCLFVNEVRKPNGSEYAPDTIYYLCLGIQQYLYENGRIDNIFCDSYYDKFTDCLDEICKKFSALYNDSHYIVTRVEEEHLWESKQLGAHSPHVLLSTLMFFNTKHFNLTNVDEHMQLSFSHIMKHWKRSASQPCATKQQPGSRNVLLRFYPPQSTLDENSRKKKVYEQQENEENPLRCPVKLYEFYLSKCPESVKTRNDVFYLLPERSCVPDSPVWYSTMALDRAALEKMLHRVKMVKEINVALLTN